jgi:hypothetical protein
MKIMQEIYQMPKIFWIAELTSIALMLLYIGYVVLHLRKTVEDKLANQKATL